MPTNNSINSPKPIDVSSGGTGLSTATTAYGVLAAGTTATGAFQNIGTGTSGQVLTSNGAGVLPSFQAAPSGALVHLSTVSPTSSSDIIFDNTIITATYQTYKIIYNGLRSTGANLGADLTLSTDNGTSYLSTNYEGDLWYMGVLINFWQQFGNSTSFLRLFLKGGGSTSGLANGETYLYNVGTSRNVVMKTDTDVTDTVTPSSQYWEHAVGTNTSSANVNCIKLTAPSGSTFDSGTVSIYGIVT